ncbi:dTDP-4-dehydrorhamnose 3,5-epimerase [Patulibacter sp. SYSU D01012]|uniref:dTDP-4-dehydrorhamnose 3,5-epimerase n=1 Tax=Patulibacter sp. SYSU D01012 TaxID=2817381 RepID=UPI001B313C69|nr:dTDP-4-dehydrorhamnose 3,5-epimerase [Patulibacter sp. SYSU D01012]
MEIRETSLPDAKLIVPRVFPDERGFFAETFRENVLAEAGIHDTWVQDNHSRSSYGVVRGLHFQIGKGAAKLVRCGRGHIWDVIVDLRKGSPTYGKWQGFDLTDENMHVLYVPVGFAHGFCVMSDVADVLYKQTNYYSGEVERGIAYNDREVAVAWPLAPELILVSDRDASAPSLHDIAEQLVFNETSVNG